MASFANAERALSAELEAHHRLCLEVSSLQTELKGLQDGSWKRFQHPGFQDKKDLDVVAITHAEPSKKMRLCACGCGLKRQCNMNGDLPPLPVGGGDQEWTEAPPGADPIAQRAYHDKLAQPRKAKDAIEDIACRSSSKQVVDPGYLERLAVPRDRARELSHKQRAGPVPKLPDLRGLQAKVIANDERAAKLAASSPNPQKPQKPPPFINCPAKPTHSSSAPELPLRRSKPLGSLLPQNCMAMPRPQRRLPSRPLSIDDCSGLLELRMRKVGRVPAPQLPSSGSESPKFNKSSHKQKVRTLDAQQLYIDKYLAAPPKPKGKHEALTMKLEALRNERLAREDGFLLPRQSQESKSNKEHADKSEEPVMPDVKWDLLI